MPLLRNAKTLTESKSLEDGNRRDVIEELEENHIDMHKAEISFQI